ncbi:hypothetical protein ACHAXR_010061 [Thalassiosira sp. AJA248-18]
MANPTEAEKPRSIQQPHQHHSSCRHRPLSRASRQLFRQDASHVLLHYFGGKGQDAPWRLGDDATTSSDSSVDPAVDKRGRRRDHIPLVDNPDDGLTDEDWYTLLGYAIDNSATNVDPEAETHICPLHPKHDVLLTNDKNSFLLQRRYRFGLSKFGALSLPLSGRAARTAFWVEERETYHQQRHNLPMKQKQQLSGNSNFLFQCGVCDKTFVSRYYLDKHMEKHHPPHSETEADSDGNMLLCPANHVCEALGGMSACVETMHQISPYYGRGSLLGKEYATDPSISSSIHSLILHFYGDSDEPTESTDDAQSTTTKHQMQKLPAQKEGDAVRQIGEMRHRAFRRNKLMMQAVVHRRLKHGENFNVADFLYETFSSDEINSKNDMQPPTSTSSCDEQEMDRLFRLCHDLMQTCFGGSIANDANHDAEISGTSNLANDLITHICEPIHCQHRLHRMAGHNQRHAVHWNDEWDEHHSFELGWYGWLVVVGVVIYYGRAFALGLGGADNLPSHDEKKKKSI